MDKDNVIRRDGTAVLLTQARWECGRKRPLTNRWTYFVSIRAVSNRHNHLVRLSMLQQWNQDESSPACSDMRDLSVHHERPALMCEQRILATEKLIDGYRNWGTRRVGKLQLLAWWTPLKLRCCQQLCNFRRFMMRGCCDSHGTTSHDLSMLTGYCRMEP